MSKQAPSTKEERKRFLLECVRLSYPNLFTPRAMKSDSGEDKKPEYSANFILDKKKHAAVIAAIEKEAVRIAVAKWGKKPVKFRSPIRDGSTFVDDETQEIKDGYSEDVVGIQAKSAARQHVLRRDKTPADEDEVYGGCYVNAVITLYPWKHPTGGSGVSAALGPVQFVRNGERFGTAVISGDEVFDDLGEDDEGDNEPPPAKSKGKRRPADDDDDPTADL